ncbi:MAG: transcriptional repressor LexA [Gammaproteobacteria bacterium]|nr:MAG: transcriptional repressor LexA [Gammaproteobacteria bacterium]
MNTLTSRQKEIFDFIKSKISNEGYPPTRMEISNFFGFKSPNAAEDHLKALKKKGFIDILSGTSRGISLSNSDDSIPVIGLVSAGSPMLAEENIEKKIPALPISSHGIDYYLRVKGDSMIDVGIFDNDLIAVNKDLKVKKNAIVIARIDDDVTVKTLKEISNNKVVLKAENDNYNDIIVNPNKVSLNFEGTCVGLIRNIS